MRFRDRRDAGERLAERLREYAGRADVAVLGIPRGGVLVAQPVAEALGAPLDVVVVRKVGHPANPEYGIAAVDEDGGVSLGAVEALPSDYLQRETETQRAEARRRVEAYRGGVPAAPLRGKVALIVDDGVATGLTALQAVRFARARGAARVVMAAPVMSIAAERLLRGSADGVVALDVPPGFMAVGQFYLDFPQTTDAEVVGALKAARAVPEDAPRS